MIGLSKIGGGERTDVGILAMFVAQCVGMPETMLKCVQLVYSILKVVPCGPMIGT